MSISRRIIIQNLNYTISNKQIFNQLNLSLDKTKTGIIGHNGIGKSTLLRLIANEIQPTSGSIKSNAKILYCPQDLSLYKNSSIAKFLNIDQKLLALEKILSDDVTPNNFAILNDDWNVKEHCIKQLNKFCLKLTDLSAKINSLSGGEIFRLWLAKNFDFHSSTDFLLFDEPTNNLDSEARNFFYQLISRWNKGLLIASHDCQLLNIMDQIIAITESGIKIYGGNFDFYLEQHQLEQDAKLKAFLDAKKTREKAKNSIQSSREKYDRKKSFGYKNRQKNDQPKALLDFAKNRSGHTQQAFNKKANRLLKHTSKNFSEAKNNLDKEYSIHVDLPKTCIPTRKTIATFENVSFHYTPTSQPILHNFNLTIRGPEKIAISGINGSGKSTMLKLFASKLTPDSGRVRLFSPFSYLDQKLEILNHNLSVLDNYKILNPNILENEARMNLAKFLFRNDTVLQKISSLSCGEKIRAALAIVLLTRTPPQLLILDEPTNHLDLENLSCLELILNCYKGALIIVCHNQMFLKKINITKIITIPFY